ncbi:MAG: metal dependent phosphohydrolase [Pseudonocardiales bacterium]|nr:metal dependent phosphohydrolase [Pseudonocardiales bacterium]
MADAQRRADAEAASIIELAKREATALRRTAQSEADALARGAALDSEAAVARARRLQEEAEAAAKAIRADATRAAAALADEEVVLRTEQLRSAAADLAAQQRAADEHRKTLESRERELADTERSLSRGEAQLVDRASALESAAADLEAQRAAIAERASVVAAQESLAAQALDAAQLQARSELERVAELSAADARTEVLKAAESGARRDVAIMVRDLEAAARVEADDRARRIVAESVQRVASEQTVETVVSVMHLPSEEMKGRIIGREGRNIRSFEAVTGVNIIIDDTPEAVLLSCFDPVRREVGRLTLEALLIDGRIHPHRIEELYERSRAEVDALCLRAAQDALLELHIDDLDPRLLPVLGRLKYRTSYGQNVLAHSLESAHVAGVIAAEMGLEPALLKRCAFLHDIGKALTHEVEGSHAIVGAALLRKHGESEAVAHAVEAHHNEVQPTTIEAVLTQAADACSAARPGARRESIESYVKRLQRIEEIASSREGVDKVFAMQAGREVRVMVSPDAIDDLEAGIIAREIAKQIEDELTYPGQIRVTVVRESRATEIAH